MLGCPHSAASPNMNAKVTGATLALLMDAIKKTLMTTLI